MFLQLGKNLLISRECSNELGNNAIFALSLYFFFNTCINVFNSSSSSCSFRITWKLLCVSKCVLWIRKKVKTKLYNNYKYTESIAHDKIYRGHAPNIQLQTGNFLIICILKHFNWNTYSLLFIYWLLLLPDTAIIYGNFSSLLLFYYYFCFFLFAHWERTVPWITIPIM